MEHRNCILILDTYYIRVCNNESLLSMSIWSYHMMANPYCVGASANIMSSLHYQDSLDHTLCFTPAAPQVLHNVLPTCYPDYPLSLSSLIFIHIFVAVSYASLCVLTIHTYGRLFLCCTESQHYLPCITAVVI